MYVHPFELLQTVLTTSQEQHGLDNPSSRTRRPRNWV
jgi:hypothetical protein